MSMGTPNQVSAVQAVVDVLRASIHRGDYGSGTKLPPERDLAKELTVSRITLREAIRILVDLGYLTSRRGAHGGTFVTELDEPYRRWLISMQENEGELEDVLEFRIALERRAARLASIRRTPGDLVEMRQAMDVMAAAEDRLEFRRADSLFHRALAAASRSPRLIAAIETARGELFLHTDHIIYTELIGEALEQHQRILDAVDDGDEDGAAQAVEAHLEATRAELRRLLGEPSSIGRRGGPATPGPSSRGSSR
jgi:DNA-binding FadR family transcriptional regulator